jgi:hypothetical protein
VGSCNHVQCLMTWLEMKNTSITLSISKHISILLENCWNRITHEAVVSYINSIEPCSKVLEFRQMEKIHPRNTISAYLLLSSSQKLWHTCLP